MNERARQGDGCTENRNSVTMRKSPGYTKREQHHTGGKNSPRLSLSRLSATDSIIQISVCFSSFSPT